MSLRTRVAGWSLLLLAMLLAAFAPGALAAPADDYRAVANDFRGDGDITACRFTRGQLVNARSVAGSIQDLDSYAPGFRTELAREIALHDAGGCSARRARSPLKAVRIVSIRPKGRLLESV